MSTRPRPAERLTFTGLVCLLLSGPVLVGLWRPLAQATQAQADSIHLSLAASGLAAVVALVNALSWSEPRRRWWPALSAALCALPLAALLGQGLVGQAVVGVALLGVAGFCGALAPWLTARLPEGLDGLAPRRKGVAVLILLFSLLQVVGTSRLSVFMGDPTHPELSLDPKSDFLVKHSCLSAYVQGAKLASEGVHNIYLWYLWPHLDENPLSLANAEAYAPFGLDAYAYPPPFLLLPRLLLTPLGDFASQRALWFMFNTLFLAAGLWIVASWVGGRAGTRALVMAPLVWGSLSTQLTLQVGNFHPAMLVTAMLALVAFDKGRPALGGALLAFAIISKISPGLLVLLLLFQRKYREILWTTIWGGVFLVLSLLVFGPAPLMSFVQYELPGLSSGEAMTFLAGPESVVINFSPFGVPFRMSLLGFDMGDEWALGKRFNSVFTLLLLGLTVVGGLKLAGRWPGGPQAGGRREQAILWCVLLTLTAMRSPLAPGYIFIAMSWMLTLAAIEVRGRLSLFAMVVLWATALVPALGDEQTKLIIYLVEQVILTGALVYYLLRSPPVVVEQATA